MVMLVIYATMVDFMTHIFEGSVLSEILPCCFHGFAFGNLHTFSKEFLPLANSPLHLPNTSYVTSQLKHSCESVT